MSNITVMFIIVVSINVLMMLTQGAISEINPGNVFYNSSGSIIDQNNVDTANPYDDLPGTGSAVETEDGNIFMDIFGSVKNWLADVTGYSTLVSALKAPYTYLKSFGLPQDFVNIVGTAWYVITLVLLILVLWGRQN